MKNLAGSMEITIAQMLKKGVRFAGALIVIGWISQIQFEKNPFIEFSTYQKQGLFERLAELFQNQQWGLLISYAGLLVLILLPLTRVAMTSVLFFKQNERTMAGISGLVMMGLIMSFLLGFYF